MNTLRQLGIICTAGMVGFLLLIGTPLAVAAPVEPTASGLSFSADGISFSTDALPLFDDSELLVPGEQNIALLWVRNLLEHDIEFFVQESNSGSTGGIIVGPLVPGTHYLEPQETKAVAVRARLPLQAGNESQNIVSDTLQVELVLQEAGSGILATAPPEMIIGSSPPLAGPNLPDTGLNDRLLPFVVGLLGTGIMLLRVARRRRTRQLPPRGQEEHHGA